MLSVRHGFAFVRMVDTIAGDPHVVLVRLKDLLLSCFRGTGSESVRELLFAVAPVSWSSGGCWFRVKTDEREPTRPSHCSAKQPLHTALHGDGSSQFYTRNEDKHFVTLAGSLADQYFLSPDSWNLWLLWRDCKKLIMRSLSIQPLLFNLSDLNDWFSVTLPHVLLWMMFDIFVFSL